MKRLKRFLALTMAIAMVISTGATGFAETGEDTENIDEITTVIDKTDGDGPGGNGPGGAGPGGDGLTRDLLTNEKGTEPTHTVKLSKPNDSGSGATEINPGDGVYKLTSEMSFLQIHDGSDKPIEISPNDFSIDGNALGQDNFKATDRFGVFGSDDAAELELVAFTNVDANTVIKFERGEVGSLLFTVNPSTIPTTYELMLVPINSDHPEKNSPMI